MVDAAIGHVFPPCPCSYNARDAMLYALGIGCTVEGGDESELRYLYEKAEDFAPFPTMALALGFCGSVGHDAVPYPPPHGAMGQIPPGERDAASFALCTSTARLRLTSNAYVVTRPRHPSDRPVDGSPRRGKGQVLECIHPSPYQN